MTRPLTACLVAVVVGASAQAQPADPVILSRLLWFDRAGVRLGGIGPVADHGNLELSPDGTRVAVAVRDRARSTRDIWIYDASSGVRTQFTSDASDENWLIWSPDGRRVLLNSFGPAGLQLLDAPATDLASGMARLSGAEGVWPVSWSPDGRVVLYVADGRSTSNDIWVLPLDGKTAPYPYLRTPDSENWAAFSPDGRWIVFSAAETGQPEAYVAPFPATGQRWRVSANGGAQARWRRDGSEIFYVNSTGRLMAVSVNGSAAEFVVNGSEPLFDLGHPYGTYHAFDVTADGERFLVNRLVVNPGARGSVVARAIAP